MRSLTLLMVCALAAAALAAVAGSTSTSLPGRNGRLVFDSDRKRNADLYTTTPTGSRLKRLTRAAADDLFGAWSADGKSIAFTSSGRAGDALYVMSASGTGVRRVSPAGVDGVDPTWSPDGTKLAFSATFGGEDTADIGVLDLTTGAVTDLTSNPADDLDPAWSPDGSRIAFASNRDDPSGKSYDLYLVTADGSTQTRLTQTPAADDGLPNWSPDGGLIAFSSGNGSMFRIFVIKVDGTGETPLTASGSSVEPAWSPDGRRIAFTRLGRRNRGQIYTMSPTGSGVRRVTNNRFDDGAPDWQPLR